MGSMEKIGKYFFRVIKALFLMIKKAVGRNFIGLFRSILDF